YKHILFRDKTFEYLNNKIHVNDLREIAKDFEKKLDIMALQKAIEFNKLNPSKISEDEINYRKYWIKQSSDYKNIVQDHFTNKFLNQCLDISKYTYLASKSSLSDFDKTPTDLQDSKVINEYNKSSHTPSESQSKSHSL
ncbi:hypothetical protein, partial [Metamycoplasma hominis]|uniref:hypothetical protein n=1 Tax=Metamycoplasma hominis TaxID=2098 RepID=UPI0013653B08